MLKAWAEVWFILAEGRRSLGFLRIYWPSKADGMSATTPVVPVRAPTTTGFFKQSDR